MRQTTRLRSTRRIAVQVTTVVTCAALAAGAAAVRAARDTPRSATPFAAAQPVAAVIRHADNARTADAGERMSDTTRAAVRRPFDHAVHEQLRCTACHGAGEQHRTLRVNTPRDCASCHHAPDRTGECTDCHAAETLPEPGTVMREVRLSVHPSARLHELPFGHSLHEPLTCRACHTAVVTLAVERTCGSCHESHHSADRSCAACHQPPQRPVHESAVHLSCAGAGCHAAELAPLPSLSRALCIMCHAPQQDHEREGACASCHLLAEGARP